MAEPEGLLPSRVSPLADDCGVLPAVTGGATTPVAVPPPSAPAREVVPDPTAAGVTQSLDERLAAVTSAGGLTALPADFGDAQGDWMTVRSENPFVVLYLDYRRADRITPEMIARHRELLQRFWQEKLRSMSQGAARFAILKKYGGPDESERLVRSYPDLIERAYEQLATRSAIEAAARRIESEREAGICLRVDEKLEDLLVDGILQPEEVRVLLEFGKREGVPRSVVADRIQHRLVQNSFFAVAEPSGWTLEAQLQSTAWVHPSRKAEATVSVAVPKKKSLLVPLFIFSLVVVMVLLIAAAMRTSSLISETAGVDSATSSTHVESAAVTVTATGSTPTAPPPAMPVIQTIPAPAPPDVLPEPEPTTTTVQIEMRVEVSAEERRRIEEELTAIRALGETNPQGGLDRIALLEQSLGAEHVEQRIEAVQLRSILEKALLQLERERDRQEAEERARVEREREWERRVASVEELMKQPNYSGAKTLADQLLADPDIPPAAAERTRQLREQALAELQRIFAGAKVKSKTGRSPRGQR